MAWGTNRALYAGGWFYSAGGVGATNIAKWNGSVWTNLGAGLFGGGFFLFYCPNDHKGRLREVMAGEGLREMPFDFDFEGAKVLVDF